MKLIYQSKKVFLSSTLKNNSLVPAFFKNLNFEKIKNSILGSKYELSIVLIGKNRSKFLNNKYRKINKATDVLSFPFSLSSGEIFITPEIAKKKAKEFYPTSPWLRGNFANYLLFLVIHAVFHLKGLEHGSKMETYERAHYNRYRRRYL